MPYIGKSTDGLGIRERFTYVASADDTSISGADANGKTLAFEDPEYVDVFLNGVRLKKGTDYNTNTANTIAGLAALAANDEIEVIVNDVFTLADMVSARSGGDFQDNIAIAKDSGVLSFGKDKEITLTHSADAGLILKHAATADDSFPNLLLQTGDTDIAVNDVLGSIQFQAPDEGTGTDAILVGAAIQAISEGDFSSSNNATKLSFQTGASEAAAEKMSLSSAGVLTVSSNIVSSGTITGGGLLTTGGSIVIPDDGNIGSASDTNAIAISSAGVVTISTNTDATNSTSGALIAHSAGIADDLYVGDGLFVTGAITGSGAIQGTNITATTAFLPDASDGAALGSTSLEFSDLFLADGAVINFGADQDINITHVADTGLTTNGSFTSTSTLQGTTITATTAFVPDASDGATLGTSSLEFSDLFLADGGEVKFGADQDVLLRHDHNSGLIIDRTNTSDNSPVSLTLQTGETDIQANDVIGKINFQAPDEATGTDAVLVSAAIQARSEGDFSSSANATSIDFMTGASETATTKMSLESGGNLNFVIDSSELRFGANKEITITHVLDTGLTITNTNTNDNLPIILQLKSEENEIVANEVIGSLEFAAGDADGTDGATVAAGIHAIAEGTFSASANATKLVFTTGVSETAAASATAKMTLSSAGLLTIADDFMIKDGGTIGVASDADAITIASNGQVTFSQTLIGTALDISGDIDVDGTTNLDIVDIDGAVDMASTLQVDGAITSSAGATITTADNNAQLTLVSTDADASSGPQMTLYRNSSSPADNDFIGRIKMIGRNDNSQDFVGVDMIGRIIDASDGTEDSEFRLTTIRNGTESTDFKITPTETVFNEDSVDLDFRVESNGNANMLFVDGGNDIVGIGVVPTAQFSHNIIQIGSQASLGANAALSTTGQTYLTHNLYYNTDGNLRVFNTSSANEGAILQMVDGIFKFSNSSATTGTPTVTERVRIDASGNLLVKKTADSLNNTTGISLNGAAGLIRIERDNDPSLQLNRLNANGQIIQFFRGSTNQVGNITGNTSSTSYNTSSDHRLKENVTADWDATTRIKQLNPVRFNFIADADTTVDGFLAHEVQSVVPEAITGTHNEVEVWKDNEELPDGVSVGDNKLDEDGNTIPVYQGIDQSKLVPLLVKTIQELEARIKALEDA